MTEQPAPTSAPAGWYADPHGGPARRWWDGTQWTVTEAAPAPVAPPVQAPPAYCRSCAAQIDPRAVICPRCGVPQTATHMAPVAAVPAMPPQPKQPGIAVLLSLLFPGAGNLYAGDSGTTAIVMLVVSGINLVLSFTIFWLLLGIPLWIGQAIYTSVDSSAKTKHWNLAHGFPAG